MSDVAFLGAEWFEHARNAIVGTTLQKPDVGCRVQFDVEGYGGAALPWSLVVRDGVVEQCARGEVADHDVVIRWKIGDAYRVLAREVDGTGALAVTTIVTALPDRPYCGPPPPMDILHFPELAETTLVPEATITVLLMLRGGPFGDFAMVQSFVEGRLRSAAFGTVEAPDICVDIPFRNHVRLRHRDIGLLDALESGRLSGDTGPLLVFAGILESEAYRRAMQVSPYHAAMTLASLGDVLNDPGVRAALDDLMAITVAP